MSFSACRRAGVEQPDAKGAECCGATRRQPALPRTNPVWQSLALRPLGVQARLAVGRDDDPHEREADRAADQVMRSPGPLSAGRALPTAPRTRAQRRCAECAQAEQEGRLQRRASATAPGALDAPPIVHAALSSPGQPLDGATRAFFEPRFGRDFGGVRIHTGAEAVAANRAVGAHAFTLGDRIAFAGGQYAPHTAAGRRLLAHELAHTLQQAGDPRIGVQRSSAPGSAAPASPSRRSSRAGGCAWGDSDEIARAAGNQAHIQIQGHARRANSSVGLEGPVPRAFKDYDEEGTLVSTRCPPQGTKPGKVDLYNFTQPVFHLAEIKPFEGWERGLLEYEHYADRLVELNARRFSLGDCRDEVWDTADEEFDERRLRGFLLSNWQQSQEGEPYEHLRPDPLPTSLVPAEERDAGSFGGPVRSEDFRLYYRNLGNGVVAYECRGAPGDEKDRPGQRAQPPPSDPQLSLPFVRDSHPLLAGWLAALETRPVPTGHGYALAVSAPAVNALRFAADGKLPYARDSLALEAGFEVVGEAFGLVGLGLIAGGLLARTAVPAAVPASEAGGLTVASGESGIATATGQTQAAARAAAAAERARRAAAAAGTTGSALSVAPADPEALEAHPTALTPGEARSESTLGRHATGLTPVLAATLDLWPTLYFAATGAAEEDGVPLPFANADEPDALGRLAWEAVAALVPYAGFWDVASLRELGLLKQAVLYANPAVLAVTEALPEQLPEIGTLFGLEGFQYIVVAHCVGA